MKPLRGIPSSRAYWDLKAEQMMNRIFDPERIIDLESQAVSFAPASLPSAVASGHPPRQDGAPEAPPPARSGSVRAAVAPRTPPRPGGRTSTATEARPRSMPLDGATRPFDRQLLLIASLGGVCLVGALCSVLFLNHSWKVQETLREERNLLLVERLRSLGPATPAAQPVAVAPTPALPSATPQAAVQQAAGSELPPPPVEEPWMQQLGALPQARSDRAPVLRVPVSPRLAAAAPPAVGTSRQDGAVVGGTPQLLGVVKAQGRADSAIFKVGGSSTSVVVGDSIGATGWRLQSAEGDSAVIERNNDVRRITLNN